MTLHEVSLLHAFNSWANNRIFDALSKLSTEQYMRDMKASHRSIHGTLTHMVSAERIWLSRWLGPTEAVPLNPAEVPTLQMLRSTWETTGYEMAKFLGGMTDKKLQDTFSAKSPKGVVYTHTYWQAFQHVVDHSTYHRGQIITMMRQLGVAPPSTGLIAFYRETAKG
jgi:uncharacterized damage-inducible protein DinB